MEPIIFGIVGLVIGAVVTYFIQQGRISDFEQRLETREDALQQTERQIAQDHSQLEEIERSYKNQIAQWERQNKELQNRIEELEATDQTGVTGSEETKNAIQKLEETHQFQIQDLQKSYQDQIQQLEETHQLQIQDLQKSYQEQIQQLEETHHNQIQSLELAYQAQYQRLEEGRQIEEEKPGEAVEQLVEETPAFGAEFAPEVAQPAPDLGLELAEETPAFGAEFIPEVAQPAPDLGLELAEETPAFGAEFAPEVAQEAPDLELEVAEASPMEEMFILEELPSPETLELLEQKDFPEEDLEIEGFESLDSSFFVEEQEEQPISESPIFRLEDIELDSDEESNEFDLAAEANSDGLSLESFNVSENELSEMLKIDENEPKAVSQQSELEEIDLFSSDELSEMLKLDSDPPSFSEEEDLNLEDLSDLLNQNPSKDNK
jgi:uncharacterized protein YsxB (DUF464 family)